MFELKITSTISISDVTLKMKSKVPPMRAIRPWHHTKQLIQSKITFQTQLQLEDDSTDTSLSSIALDASSKSELSKNPQEEAIDALTPIALPQGFIPQKSMHTQKPTLRNATFVPHAPLSETILTIDSHQAVLWKSGKRIKTLSTHVGHKKDGFQQSSMAGVRCWVFVPSWSVFIVSNMQMEMKVSYKNNFLID